jgi:hypothetical protein
MLFFKGIGLGFNTRLIRPEGRGIKPLPRINYVIFHKKNKENGFT